MASVGTEVVGCLRFEPEAGYLHVRRVAVDPAWQGRGIGHAMMAWAHDFARDAGFREVRVGVRLQLPQNRRFYERLGYTLLAEHQHPGHAEVTWIEMRREV